MNSTKSIDWSQLWYPGRKTPFTREELARAGRDAPSPTLVAIACVNLATIAFVVLLLSPPAQTARLTGMLVGLAVTGFAVAARLWVNPWRRPLLRSMLGIALTMVAMGWLLRWRVPEQEERRALAQVLMICGSMVPLLLWFLTVWRAHQIEARLREQSEREKAIEMARRLAAAQLEPHFLFNTLASVQHWVQTHDERAGPLLDALTGYLRATLPMFDQPLLILAQELEVVQRYLQVMQARLGDRLNWRVEIDAALHGLRLPPGALLTLAENAIEHGIEPQLRGGELLLRGRREGDAACLEVIDNGPGPAAGMAEGVGLANLRQRLALTCGDHATLTLGAAPGGGFGATLRLPLDTGTR